ncbi:MAG: glycosyl hydrolase-related protein, partial [Spirochaetales bacterium]|nr:glycosyl hydrolase-related protein [Spirochaetales bacterium]
VWDDELYLEAHRGTYTSRARLKRENRRLEVLYRNAEIIGSLSRIYGAPPFQEELNVGWKLLLLNQFHDTLTGTHVPAAHGQIDAAYAEAREVGRRILARSAAWIGEHLPGADDAVGSWVVFNSLSWRRSGCVALALNGLRGDELVARAHDGAELPGQEYDGMLWIRLEEVPSVGWSTVSLHRREPDGGDDAWVRVEGRTIRTPHYLLEWDAEGAVSRLFDRDARREVVAGPANVFQLLDDDPGEKFSAWDIAYHIDEHPIPVALERPWKCVSSGPLFVVLEASWTVLDSRIEQRMWLYRHERHIEFETRVKWQNDRKLLKVAFPTTMRSRRGETHAPFGAIERATHRNTSWERAKYEVPMHYWVDLSEPRYGVALLNDGSYGCDIHEGTIRLSLLRSPIRPDPESDIGEHEFRYALYPHTGDRAHGLVHRRGYEYNMPFIVHERSSEPPTDGALPPHHSNVSVDAPEIVIETIKEAESGEGLILRAYEATGSVVTASVDGERVPSRLVETDLLERPTGRGSVGGEPSLRDIEFGPYEIRSFLMR